MGRWLAPNALGQACNNRVVHRSNALLRWDGGDSSFRFQARRAQRAQGEWGAGIQALARL